MEEVLKIQVSSTDIQPPEIFSFCPTFIIDIEEAIKIGRITVGFSLEKYLRRRENWIFNNGREPIEIDTHIYDWSDEARIFKTEGCL